MGLGISRAPAGFRDCDLVHQAGVWIPVQVGGAPINCYCWRKYWATVGRKWSFSGLGKRATGGLLLYLGLTTGSVHKGHCWLRNYIGCQRFIKFN